MAAAANVASLRNLLESRFPDALPLTHTTVGAVSTGIEVLDRALPAGGFPRGRLSTWSQGPGATAFLHATGRAVLASGERAVWIDGAGVTSGSGWAEGPFLLRPREPLQGLRWAEELLRSSGFALVVITGTYATDREWVRLSRSAREGGSALVAVGNSQRMAALRLTSCIPPWGFGWRRDPQGEPIALPWVTLQVRAMGLGWSREVEVQLPVEDDELRLSVEPALADRRGATR